MTTHSLVATAQCAKDNRAQTVSLRAKADAVNAAVVGVDAIATAPPWDLRTTVLRQSPRSILAKARTPRLLQAK
jgi:hypothetical protein